MNRVARLVGLIHLPHRRSRTAPGGTLVRPVRPVKPDERAAARRLYPPTRVRAIPVEPPVRVNGSKPPKES